MATTADPYNWKSLQRKDLMSLSGINPVDERKRKFKGGVDTYRDYSYNLFNMDIIGSSPKKFGVLTQKTDFINKNDDIERSYPKELIVKLDKPDYQLYTADLKLKIPKFHHNTTRPPTNPLEPKYNLPKVEEVPAPIPKFIRDNINYDDVDGSKPKKLYMWKTRNEMFMNNDIPGSSPRKAYIRKTKYSNFNYADVTHDQFKTNRHVNPLDPVYQVKEKDGTQYIYGNIEGSKPQTYPFKYPEPFNLRTDDIDGCKIGSMKRINQFVGQDLNLNIKDMKDTQAGSKKRGISTNRHLNPIWPNYEYPGHLELKGKDYNPYGKTAYNEKNKYTKNNYIDSPDQNNSKQQQENVNDMKSKTSANFHTKKDSEKSKYKSTDNLRVLPQPELADKAATIQYDDDNCSYQKPDPFYGYTRDQYLKCAKLKKVEKPSTGNFNKRSTSTKKNNNSFSGGTSKNFGSTMGNFGLTKAQKLDQFIGNL